ncbi:MAG: hypothetical protein JW909_08895 [Planctomycetes bacterium]|nr:hypothetical protein [Planctomycetota bacterium]
MLVPGELKDVESIREFMTIFMKTRYAEVLGEDAVLLEQPFGLELLVEKYHGPHP